MRKVLLNMHENYKYETIKQLVDNDGNKYSAAFKLGYSIRTINRLIIKYRSSGKSGFIHGNAYKKPNCAYSEEIKNKVIDYYTSKYPDANIVHFTEILRQDMNLNISDTTIRSWLRDVFVISPKANRRTKKDVSNELRMLRKQNSNKKVNDELLKKINNIEVNCAHPHRPRCSHFGQMIQMDASSFKWFNNDTFHLHLAVDDATGHVVGAYFDKQETLNGYYNVFHQILTDYGIPTLFYTDRRTIFEYKRKSSIMDSEDTFTQFSYACKQLGVQIKTTSVAQAKGRIERLNSTFQSRLPIELRRANVASLEEANEFLKHYLKKFNQSFSLLTNDTKSSFDKQPSLEKLNYTLAVISDRVIDHGHCIRYKKCNYLPVNANGFKHFLAPKTKCLVIESFDNNLFTTVGEEIFALIEVPKVENQSLEQSFKAIKPRKTTIPNLDHPWRRSSFIRFRDDQHYYNQSNVYN